MRRQEKHAKKSVVYSKVGKIRIQVLYFVVKVSSHPQEDVDKQKTPVPKAPHGHVFKKMKKTDKIHRKRLEFLKSEFLLSKARTVYVAVCGGGLFCDVC